MTLNPPAAGLRPLRNKSIQPAKVSVAIAPGDVLYVSDHLAAQLEAASRAMGQFDPEVEAAVAAGAAQREADEAEAAAVVAGLLAAAGVAPATAAPDEPEPAALAVPDEPEVKGKAAGRKAARSQAD